MASSPEVIVRMDRRRTAFAALLSLIFIPIGLSMVHSGSAAVVVFGVACLVLFGGASLLLVGTVFRPPVAIAFDERGVRFGGVLPSMRFRVPWEEIAAVRIFRFEAAPVGGGMRMLGFVPVDAAASVWRLPLARTNRRLTDVPVAISGNTVAPELEEIVEEMRRFQPRLQLEHGDVKAAGLGKLTRPSHWGRAR